METDCGGGQGSPRAVAPRGWVGGCDNTMSFGHHTWCRTSEHCTMNKARVGTGI